MVNKNDLFFCYDSKMKDWLSYNGFEYLTHAISVRNKKHFWLFLRSGTLQASIDEFIARKNRK